MSSEIKNEEIGKAEFFNSPTSGSLVQRSTEFQSAGIDTKATGKHLALTLLQPVVQTFSGNPIDYWPFIRAFENLIEMKTSSKSAQSYYLMQYTTGEV